MHKLKQEHSYQTSRRQLLMGVAASSALALVLPRTGEPIVVVPAFEVGRMREKLTFAADVRAWQEDESPTKIAAAALEDRGIRTGCVGVEETAAFTFFDHFHAAAPGFQ